jgi:uncharacterized protein
MLYVDASALLKLYIDEPDSERAVEMLRVGGPLATGRHAIVEVRRNLARLLDGAILVRARAAFATDLESIALIELDAQVCELAAIAAEELGSRSLDALHLGALQRLGAIGTTLITFDIRLATYARTLGFTVVGA